MKTQNAFSLIEVLATLVVAGILASVALPNMRNFIMNSRITAKTNELVKAINFARMESISRPSTPILISPYSNGDWTTGCKIGRDNNVNQQLDDNVNQQLSEIVKIFTFKPDQVAITSLTTLPNNQVEYASRGRPRVPPGSTSIEFTICNSQDPKQYPGGQKVTIVATGRVSSERIQCQ